MSHMFSDLHQRRKSGPDTYTKAPCQKQINTRTLLARLLWDPDRVVNLGTGLATKKHL